MSFIFDDAIGISAIGMTASAGSENAKFNAMVHAGWDIRGNANGGYLIALALAAMRTASGGRDPVTVTAHYLAPMAAGPINIDTQVVKQGRRFTNIVATVRQGDRDAILAVGLFGQAPTISDGFSKIDGRPPQLPALEKCVLREPTGEGFDMALMSKVTVRLHPDDVGFMRGEPSGTALVRGWFSFPDERPIDALALVLATDVFPPSIFNLQIAPGWVPTLELTAHVRGVPAPGPLRCNFRSRFVGGGMWEEDGELWDSRDVLVCQSRQISLLPIA